MAALAASCGASRSSYSYDAGKSVGCLESRPEFRSLDELLTAPASRGLGASVLFNPRFADAGETLEGIPYPNGTRHFVVWLARSPAEINQADVYVLPSELGARRFFTAQRRYLNGGWWFVGNETYLSAVLQRRRNVVAIWETPLSPQHHRAIVLGCLRTQAQTS